AQEKMLSKLLEGYRRTQTARATRSREGRTTSNTRGTEETRRAQEAAGGGTRTDRVRQKIQRRRAREAAQNGRKPRARRNAKVSLRRHGNDADGGIRGSFR